jgi:hypothetical protein
MLEIENTSRLGTGEAFDRGRSADLVIHVAIPQVTYDPHMIVLPRRPGESPLAPQQYYYPASPTGVVPCWWGDAQQAERHH